MFWSFQKTATTRKQLFSFRHNKEECGLLLIKETRALLREEASPPVIYFDLTFDAKGKKTALTFCLAPIASFQSNQHHSLPDSDTTGDRHHISHGYTWSESLTHTAASHDNR